MQWKSGSWQKLFFFCFIETNLFLSKSHHFFYFFLREHFSARRCSLCQTLACTDRRSHKQKLLLLWENKLLKKDRDACSRFCFSNPHTFRKVEKASSVHFCWWQKFPSALRDGSPLFCSTETFCSLAKRNWKFCKISDNSLLKLFLWTRKMKFWHLCEKFYAGGRTFLFSFQTCWRKNLFSLESSSQMVLPDR